MNLAATNNQLLRLLPSGEFKRLLSVSQQVQLVPGQILQHWRLPMDHLYFLEDGLVSVSAKVASDRFVEVWFVGSEGVVGAPFMLAEDEAPLHRRMVQIEGSAWRVPISEFRNLLNSELPTLRAAVKRYLYTVLMQTSQSGACNSIHSIEQRTSRWLLLVRKALRSESVPLTHEVLSRVLGVRRASVTQCLDALQKSGCILATRGGIIINDVSSLEARSCGCHKMIESQLRSVVAAEIPRPSQI